MVMLSILVMVTDSIEYMLSQSQSIIRCVQSYHHGDSLFSNDVIHRYTDCTIITSKIVQSMMMCELHDSYRSRYLGHADDVWIAITCDELIM